MATRCCTGSSNTEDKGYALEEREPPVPKTLFMRMKPVPNYSHRYGRRLSEEQAKGKGFTYSLYLLLILRRSRFILYLGRTSQF